MKTLRHIVLALLLALPVAADQVAGGGGGTPGISANALYGDGSTGTLNCSGGVTITAPKYYSNVTVSAGCQITTRGFPIFISGTLTLDNAPASSIIDSQSDAVKSGGAGTAVAAGGVGGSAGVGVASGGDWANPPTAIVGGAGGAPTNGAGVQGAANSAESTCAGGGGTGGAGGNGDGAGTGGAARAGGTPGFACQRRLTYNYFVGKGFTILAGGSQGGAGAGGGGGSGANSGGGGGGGAGSGAGIVAVYARTISRTGSTAACAIKASGGAGGAGGAGTTGTGTGGAGGGGGGGGGGVVYLVYDSLIGTVATSALCADGGAGGNGSSTGANPGTGGDSGFGGLIEEFNTGTGIVMVADGTATQNLHSGATGGTAVTTRADL